ncbi:hypothetical protein L0664_00315 [Octadecabacter sp. G9-8]|uniref:Cytochrome c domain-containing protein n=1 Tax=Octadecabacter dasysiphoniae TaxID=2909341 RepID=A0ABS9CTY2_9RHOB|nr:hypothetical protein [Octadecabacter dasysiphoniae]MCF2869493.1 hypothetical protein [Octadecabacter dasysiphoniae]
MKKIILFGALLGVATFALAEDAAVIDPPMEGSVTVQQGLDAWSRIHDVVSHPRCANCHTGPSDRPMWSGPSFGAPRQHGMNIRAGESRMGLEYLQCSSCHTTKDENWDNANAMPHAAPRVAMGWALAPMEAHWFGRTAEQICAQLRDPEQNGGRDMIELAEHLNHDLILHWAWAPGGGREPAPYSLQEHVDDLLDWGVAGMPCPQD